MLQHKATRCNTLNLHCNTRCNTRCCGTRRKHIGTEGAASDLRVVEQEVISTSTVQPVIVHSPAELWKEIEKLEGQLKEEFYIFESLT